MKNLVILIMIFLLPMLGEAINKVPQKAASIYVGSKDETRAIWNKGVYYFQNTDQLDDQMLGVEGYYYIEITFSTPGPYPIVDRTFTIGNQSYMTIVSNTCAGTNGNVCRVYFSASRPTQGLATMTYYISFTRGEDTSNYTFVTNMNVVRGPPDDKNQCELGGSIFRPDSQSVAEEVEIKGSPASLTWSSSYANEYLAYYKSVSRSSSFYPEGWNISLQHQYDRVQKRLFKGNGR